MVFTEPELRGACVIDLERREDSRGFFARTFCHEAFLAHGLKPVIAQANVVPPESPTYVQQTSTACT